MSIFLHSFLLGRTVISFLHIKKNLFHIHPIIQMGISMGIFFLVIIVCVIVFSFTANYTGLFVILSTPFGGLTRYYLSKKNKNWPRFPLFTFIVNLFGCIFFEILMGITNRYYFSSFSLELIQGVEVGFCGSLTTVSTFANELMNSKVPLKWRYFYAFLSVVIPLILSVSLRELIQYA